MTAGTIRTQGRKVRQLLDANGWRQSVFAEADRLQGGASGIDCSFTWYPIREPSFLYGGYPPKDLKHKFLIAQESNVEYLSAGTLPEGFQIINLPGHFFDMVGFRNADDVVYLADCLSSKETFEKYQIAFIYDVAAYIGTLEMVKKLDAKLFVPSHAGVTDNIAPCSIQQRQGKRNRRENYCDLFYASLL